jgi:hypothetical protein
MNGWQLVATLAGTLFGGGLIGIIFNHWREHPRAVADARKTHAEAERIEVEVEGIKINTLEGQIARLDQRVKLLERQVQDCHQDRDLALAAARYLWDRLQIAAPSDEAVARLRDYLIKPPALTLPRSMEEELGKVN